MPILNSGLCYKPSVGLLEIGLVCAILNFNKISRNWMYLLLRVQLMHVGPNVTDVVRTVNAFRFQINSISILLQ